MIHVVSSELPQLSELPVLESAAPQERADAARNRRRVLAAAERLFERDGVDCTSMDAIAAEAGVGKGTLFRRFGDRASLVRTLLGDREAAFQDAFIRGPAPLGPGAPPVERAIAFGEHMLELLDERAELIAAAEAGKPGARLRSAPQATYHVHLSMLVREAAPDLDAALVADVLLADLTAELFLHRRRVRGTSLAELREHWAALVTRLLG